MIVLDTLSDNVSSNVKISIQTILRKIVDHNHENLFGSKINDLDPINVRRLITVILTFIRYLIFYGSIRFI